MALFRSWGFADPNPVLETDRMILRAPVPEDYEAWAAIRAESRDYLAPWEPIWAADDLTRLGYRRRLKRNARDMREGEAYPFFLLRKSDRALIGGLTLFNIRRGVAQSGAIGYWVAHRHAGQGHMTEAVRRVLGFAFVTLRLARVEAACLPHNAASIRVIEKSGFTREGYARGYLCIAGRWEDHLLFAKLSSDPV